MANSIEFQKIVDDLYASYKSRGFIRDEEVVELATANNLSLSSTERLTGNLIGLGVMFADAEFGEQDEDEDTDYSRTDYEAIFKKVLLVAPGQEIFIEYVRGIRPPQWREWRTLMPQAKSGNKFARDNLFEMYLRVVVKLTLMSYKSHELEFDDLLQEGALGLLRAIQNYDFHKHGSFVSYFPFWVRQYMDRAKMDKGQLIRLPVHVYEMKAQYKAMVEKLKANNRQLITISSIAKEMGISVSKVKQISKYIYSFISLEEFMLCYKDGFLECTLVDANWEAFIGVEDRRLQQENISSILNLLPERESDVLSLRYGIINGQERTLEELGIEFNITRERVRQIEYKALQKLRRSPLCVKLKDLMA